jgi:hypothetical protein
MKTLRDLNLHSCCIHKKFLDRQDLFDRFFEINSHIDISAEPLEELTVRHNINSSIINNSKIYCSSISAISDNIINFPLFWMYGRPLVDYVPNDTYKFITMNGAASTTRSELISKLQSAEILNQGVYSLWPDISLPSEKDATSHYHVKKTLPKEWYHSLYEFQIETCSLSGVPYLFISEKTFRPLLSGKPFLNYGYAGMYKKLIEYGFTFDCDLSFDEDVDNRFDLYVKEVIRLINTPFNVTIVKNNKKVARQIYNDNLKHLKIFEEQLENLKDMIYLDKEMIEYLK